MDMLISSSPFSVSLLVPLNPTNPVSLSPSRPFPRTHLLQTSNGSRLFASKNPPKPEVSQLLELQGLGSFAGDEDGEDEDGETEGFYMPFDKMNEWVLNKPPGFGVGKVYDTRVEEQLLDEMRQSREAQAANLIKLKNEPLRLGPAKKAEVVVPIGVRVRVTNLPKKKNVHRDLSSAFKGVAGLLSIVPAVSGNKKTRDPVCKGFGFVYFKSDKDANRFIETFSRKNVAFGKIEKQIKCELAESLKPEAVVEKPVANASPASEVFEVETLEDDQSSDSSLEEWENSVLSEFDEADDDEYDEEDDVSEWEDFDEEDMDEEDIESVTELELNDNGSYEQRTEKVRQTGKVLAVKDKEAKVPKIKTPSKVPTPGSTKRLKLKEKAMLTDVLSKYGKKSAAGSKKAR